MKTEVYTWRLSREVKADIGREARARKVPVSHSLDVVVNDWLKKSGADPEGEEA